MLSLLLLTGETCNTLGKSWRRITPLRSTTEDVSCKETESRCQCTFEDQVVMVIFLAIKSPKGHPRCEDLKPLQTTHEEVEQVLGKPTSSAGSRQIYENNTERVDVVYSTGKCEAVAGRWNVAPNLLSGIAKRVPRREEQT
jgi:hypothetical protein